MLPRTRTMLRRLPSRARRGQPCRADSRLVRQIRERGQQLDGSPDQEIRRRSVELREQLSTGTRMPGEDSTITECFALTLQASQRTLGMRPYDVQLLGGLVMTRSATAEMRTGEGKTLTSALAAVVAGMTGRGVHVCTVNAYLCKRDFQHLRPVYEMLGLSVGLIETQASRDAKQAAYGCDITYSTGYDVGFDFLRDEAQRRVTTNVPPGITFRNRLRGWNDAGQGLVQTRRPLAMIDEVDSVLIDEATTPLVISGDQGVPTDPAIYRHAMNISRQLTPDVHYLIDRSKHSIRLTTEGFRYIHDCMPGPQAKLARPWKRYVEQALRADHIYQCSSS